MSQLTIYLLGRLQVTREGESVSGFDSDKVRALLAYLAVEANQPHSRGKLASIFWPDWPERSARTNLRRALANLRQVIGDHLEDPPFLLIDRQTIQFNTSSNYWLDVSTFTETLKENFTRSPDISQLEEAIALYNGSFLEGFSIPESAAFEEWRTVTREWLQREAMEVLGRRQITMKASVC